MWDNQERGLQTETSLERVVRVVTGGLVRCAGSELLFLSFVFSHDDIDDYDDVEI